MSLHLQANITETVHLIPLHNEAVMLLHRWMSVEDFRMLQAWLGTH